MKRKPKTPSLQMNHATENIPLKNAQVDKIIAPLVRWLNGFEGVITLFSCEGEKLGMQKELAPDKRPYLSFICWNQLELQTILADFRYGCEVTVEWDRGRSCLVYRAEWSSRERLEDDIRTILARWEPLRNN